MNLHLNLEREMMCIAYCLSFFFQQVSGHCFLIEAVVDVNAQLLSIATKAENSTIEQKFSEHLRKCLEQEWIQTTD